MFTKLFFATLNLVILPFFYTNLMMIELDNLMIDIFGEAGRGARSAVGMSSLPFNISVEVEMTVKLFD